MTKDIKEIQARVLGLKKERNAVILVHNYQVPEIQDVADYIGDSLGLSIQASKTNASNIIFCGVDFMAESAKVLNPGKQVIHPEPAARCPMAAMVDVEGLQKLKKEHPEAAVVTYVNTTAEVKAESDICCTSANAVKVVKNLAKRKIIFVPDVNLGLYVQRFVPDKEFVFWQGYCHVHQAVTRDEVLELKNSHPDAEIIVHPECVPEVIDIADKVFSTEGMVNYVSASDKKEFIIITEKELGYRLRKSNPGKSFYVLSKMICPTMKKITLEKVLRALEQLEPAVELKPEIMVRALKPLKRMMEIGRGD